uniref:Pentatricopeptide repeat-containing protein At3g29230 n=1 Tax=Anthurium amnicola TaxID=1678845 RepID=A0A1D1ZDX2_9ARAE
MASAAVRCWPPCNLQEGNRAIQQQLMQGRSRDAILTYVRMQEWGLSGDNFTFPLLLKAASNFESSRMGATLHGQSTKNGYSDHAFVQTALLNMYSSLGEIDEAFCMFMAMPRKDLVAWNSMLKAWVCHGRMDEAIKLFEAMPLKDHVSFNTMMSGFAKAGRIDRVEEFFNQCPSRDAVSWNTLISAYVKADKIRLACSLFEEMPERNVVSWNTLMAGYIQSQLYAEAFELFYDMKARGFEPNHLTFAGVLSACAHMGLLDTGREIHIHAGQVGLTWNPHVVASLIDMYAKCGGIEGALEVFYKAPHKDIFCWNAMMSSLALHGHGAACIRLFNDMQTRGMKPDDITFIGLLSACSHAGLVDDGCRFFAAMEKQHGAAPKAEHYGCLVDLLARAGHLERAYDLVESTPFELGAAVLGALLGACAVHRNLQIGEAVATRLLARTGGLTDGEYMMLANMYAACGRWEEASRWRGVMNGDEGVKKTAGWSGIEVAGRVHRFLAGEVCASSST